MVSIVEQISYFMRRTVDGCTEVVQINTALLTFLLAKYVISCNNANSNSLLVYVCLIMLFKCKIENEQYELFQTKYYNYNVTLLFNYVVLIILISRILLYFKL
jgi:hypothetical protein